MNQRIISTLIIIGYVLIMIAFLIGRYSIYTDHEKAYRLDRWSGKVTIIYGLKEMDIRRIEK